MGQRDFNRETRALVSSQISHLEGRKLWSPMPSLYPLRRGVSTTSTARVFLHHFATEDAARLLRLLFSLTDADW